MTTPTPTPPVQPPPQTGSNTVAQDINWADFRDHLATAHQDGRRRWLYPRRPAGRFYRARTYVSWLLLAIMFAGPFIRIQGNPLLMINIVARRFSILGQIFWPQDMVIFAVAMLVFLTGIIIFTSAFGRLWCGWTCPQTLLMEMVFRKIEYAIEGDGPAQKALAAAPWTKDKILRRVAKHGIFFGLSFVIGNTLLSYIIGSEALIKISTENPALHWHGLTFMLLFTLLFYAIFARFREQACTFICPYGRFQSAALDENTLLVAYDRPRGERRAPLRREETPAARQAAGAGDCVDCHLCVAVCPTGIDIRNGTQMECVNCTACIDACDSIMDKVGRPRGLVRFASQNNIERGQKWRFTPRLAGYVVVLVALVTLFLFLILSRTAIETTVLRAPGGMFQTMADGRIENLYTVKLINKTHGALPVELRLEQPAGELVLLGAPQMVVPAEQLAETSLLLRLAPGALHGIRTDVKIGVYAAGKKIAVVKSNFVGPRSETPAAPTPK